MIEESQYVILVCSPTLAQLLREPGSHILHMEKGKYYANTIVNYVQPIKFIPVLLHTTRKGRHYFTNFGKCLVWSGQTELARHIGGILEWTLHWCLKHHFNVSC